MDADTLVCQQWQIPRDDRGDVGPQKPAEYQMSRARDSSAKWLCQIEEHARQDVSHDDVERLGRLTQHGIQTHGLVDTVEVDILLCALQGHGVDLDRIDDGTSQCGADCQHARAGADVEHIRRLRASPQQVSQR